MKALLVGLIAMVVAAGAVQAASYSEFVDGDMSGNPAQPTPLSLTAGSNMLIGEASSVDFDYLRITVPANHTLSAITVSFHVDINRVYAGLQAGPTWTAGAGTEINPSQLLGWVNFPTNPHHAHTGEDILDDIGSGAGATGFTPPLPSGVYTFLFQTVNSAVQYGLDFTVTPIGGSLLPGDFNGDRVVNNADLDVWRTAFGRTTAADANNDGVTDGEDLLIWQRNLGLTGASPTAHAVPEPAAALLALGAFAGLAAWRRRRA